MTTTFDFGDFKENKNLNVILEVIENLDTPISTLQAILEKTAAKNIIEPIKSKIQEAVYIAMERKNSTDISIFDFDDGNGKVSAHRHINPDGSFGGWVADTASVDSSVYVGENVLVYGLARVSEESTLSDNVHVFGKAQIFGKSCISDNASVGDNAKIYGGTHVRGNARIHGNLELCTNSRLVYPQNYQFMDSTAEKTNPKADAQKIISKEKNKNENVKETTISFDLANDEEKILTVAQNPKTSPDILDSLVKNSNVVIRIAAVNNPNIRPSTLEAIAKKTLSDRIIFAIATNTQASAESLAILLKREICRNTLAKNPNTPCQLLIALAESNYKNVFYNPSLPFEILNRLAGEENYEAMWALERHPDTTFDTLKILADKGNYGAMSALARHPDTNIETLRILAEKGNSVAMSALARNPDTDSETLKQLAEEGDHSVISALLENPNTPLELLESSIIKEHNYSYNPKLAIFLAQNNNVSVDTLSFLAKKYTHYLDVRISIAQNKNVTSEILDALIYNYNGNKHKGVRLCLELAKHPNASAELLVFLSKIKDVEVVNAVANNLNTPEDLRLILDDQCNEKDDESDFLGLQNLDFAPIPLETFYYDKQCVIKYLYVYDIGIEETNEFMKHRQRIKNGEWTSYYHVVEAEKSRFKVKKSVNIQPTGFKIPPPPEPLEFNTDRISEIKTESKKVSAMLNAIYEQDETPSIAEKSTSQTTQSVLNLDEKHLEIVKILATRPEWERNELQKMMKGMMIDGVLEHINEAFFDYRDEAFIEGDDPIEINVELYKEIFK